MELIEVEFIGGPMDGRVENLPNKPVYRVALFEEFSPFEAPLMPESIREIQYYLFRRTTGEWCYLTIEAMRMKGLA